MAASDYDITRRGLDRSWDAGGTRHRVADAYARLGTKDATRRRSGSEGRCGKRESELDGDWVRGIGVAQAVDSLNSGLVRLGEGSNLLGTTHAQVDRRLFS